MNKSRTIHDQVINKFWTSHKQVMNKSRPSHEQVMDRSWTSHEQVMNKSWTSHEQVLYFKYFNYLNFLNFLLFRVGVWWVYGVWCMVDYYSSDNKTISAQLSWSWGWGWAWQKVVNKYQACPDQVTKICEKLWKSHELVVNKLWTSREQVVTKSWTSYDPILNICKHVMKKYCTNEQVLNKLWKIVKKLWTRREQEMNKSWISLEQVMNKVWTRAVQELLELVVLLDLKTTIMGRLRSLCGGRGGCGAYVAGGWGLDW